MRYIKEQEDLTVWLKNHSSEFYSHNSRVCFFISLTPSHVWNRSTVSCFTCNTNTHIPTSTNGNVSSQQVPETLVILLQKPLKKVITRNFQPGKIKENTSSTQNSYLGDQDGLMEVFDQIKDISFAHFLEKKTKKWS